MKAQLPGTIKQVLPFADCASIVVEELIGNKDAIAHTTTVTAQGETVRDMLKHHQLTAGRHCVINGRLVPNHIGGFNVELNTDHGDELLLFPVACDG